MPGEETAVRFVDAMAPSGPGWLLALLVALILAVLAFKVLPIYRDSLTRRDDANDRKVDAGIELEKRREERKAEESASRERRDRERSEMEGRWIQQMERSVNVQSETNAVVSGIKASMDALEQAIGESRSRSAEMYDKVNVIHDHVTREE